MGPAVEGSDLVVVVEGSASDRGLASLDETLERRSCPASTSLTCAPSHDTGATRAARPLSVVLSGAPHDDTIDCDTCVVRGLACHDCVVTVLLGPPPS